MLKMRNGWELTDSESMQCRKQIGKGVYKFMEVVWLDTVDSDPRAENAKDEFDNYVVRADEVDMNLMTLSDVGNAIASFNYNSVKDLMESYDIEKVEDVCSLLAEMIFESAPYSSVPISDVVSWADAEKIIQGYIDKDT